MKIGGCLAFVVCFLVLLSVSIASDENGIEIEYDVGPTHNVVPRSIRVYSRGPDPDDPVYKGPRVSKHLHNVVQGGTVGLEFDVKKGMGRFGPFWDKIRRYLPKFHGNKHEPDFVPEEDPVKDAEILDPVGRGLINPRLKPLAREEMEWERV